MKISIPWSILFLVGGIVLLNNTVWFAGANLIGWILVISAGVLLGITGLVLIFIALVVWANSDPGFGLPRTRGKKYPPRW